MTSGVLSIHKEVRAYCEGTGHGWEVATEVQITGVEVSMRQSTKLCG